MFKFNWKLIIAFGIILLLNSCYEDYLVLSSNFSKGEISGSKIYFFQELKASQPPKGITKFPDGGRHKVVFKNLSLYCYDNQTENLESIFNFGKLPECGWEYYLSLENNKLAFSINPSLGWIWRIENSSSDEFEPISKKFMKVFLLDTQSNEMVQIDVDAYNPTLSAQAECFVYLKRDSLKVNLNLHSLLDCTDKTIKTIETTNAHIPLYWINDNTLALKANGDVFSINIDTKEVNALVDYKMQKKELISIKELKTIMNQTSFKDQGFILENNWKKDKQDYIADIIQLHGNLNYRKAIIETILDNNDKSEIKDIISQMEQYKTQLKGYEQSKYEVFSEETISLLKKILIKD